MSRESLRDIEVGEVLGPSLLVLVRHGESERNKAKGGNVRFPDKESLSAVRGAPSYLLQLTDEGRKQARELGKFLSEEYGDFDMIYHSGYLSTIQTTEEILRAYPDDSLTKKCPIRQDFLIRERDPGFVYDMTVEEIERAYPWLGEYWQTFGRFFGKAPGGESLVQVAGRVRYFLDNLLWGRTANSVLVVTHAGTLQAFRFLLEGWTYEEASRYLGEQKPDNCCVVAYGCKNSKQKLTLGSGTPRLIRKVYR